MDLSLTEDQALLQATARPLLTARSPIARLSEWEDAPDADDQKLWAEMAELGWLGLVLPSAAGGSGGTLCDLELLCEELGRNLNPLPFVPVTVAAAAALEHATADVALEFLQAIADGSRRVVLAVGEGNGGWQPDAMTARLRAGHVTGTKTFVEGAATADVFLVAACDDDGITLVAVDRAATGVEVTPLSTIAGHGWSRVELDAPGAPIGAGWAAIDAALTRTAVMHAAWCVGGAAQLLADTVPYVSQRYQFGVPIGSFQAVQHRLADCDVAVAESETLARLAAWQLDHRLPDARRMASTAFVRATDAFVEVARSCHQVWGGSASARRRTCTCSVAGPRPHSSRGEGRRTTSTSSPTSCVTVRCSATATSPRHPELLHR